MCTLSKKTPICTKIHLFPSLFHTLFFHTKISLRHIDTVEYTRGIASRML